MVEWCEDESLLASLCGFHHLPASQLQSITDVHAFCGMFERFVQSLQDNALNDEGAVTAVSWPTLSADSITALAAAASSATSASVTWLPDYGCALLALEPPSRAGSAARTHPGKLTLLLVCLDDWGFRLHSFRASGDGRCQLQHSAACPGHTLLSCGQVAAEQHPALVWSLTALMEQCRKQREKLGQKGFQRTPAFVHACVLRVLLLGGAHSGPGEAQPRGGFTDVGQHTGGVPRDTAWPLVRSVLQELVERGGQSVTAPPTELFRHAIAHFRLWLLERQVQLVQAASATPDALTAGMQLLSQATAEALQLACDVGHDMTTFEAACQAARRRLGAMEAQRALGIACAYEFPAAAPCSVLDSCRLPTGFLPVLREAGKEGSGLVAARLRAAKNLGSLPLLQPSSSFSGILSWMQLPVWQSQRHAGQVGPQLLLSGVECELFHCARNGLGSAPLDAYEVAAMGDVVDVYRAVLGAHLQATASRAHMRVELRSREVLVVWIAYCLVHSAACAEHPLTRDFGVALRFSDLGHLVLRDRVAVDAQQAVIAYLQAHAAHVAGKDLFSLRGRDGSNATFDFALRFAKDSTGLQDIWSQEAVAAEARISSRWQEVQRKKQDAQQIRERLSALEEEQQVLREVLAEAQAARDALPPLYRRQRKTPEQAAADAKVSTCQSLVTAKARTIDAARQQLTEAEAPPPPLIQPLPGSQNLALQWLFFLHMPPSLQHLLRTAFLAQQVLLPCPASVPEVGKAVAVHAFCTSLAQHCSTFKGAVSQQPMTVGAAVAGKVSLMSRCTAPTHVGSKNVDACLSPQDGVWHPDDLPAEIGWQGTGSAADKAQSWPAWFNPFADVPERLTSLSFTEKLAEQDNLLQWALHQGSAGGDGSAATAAERGNFAVCRPDAQPDWLSKPAYLAFAALRAYPLGQMRRLCSALHERVLPLDHPAVHTLVWQALCHLGELTDSSPPALLWR